MAFQPVPDVAAIDVIFTLNGVTVQNTHYALLPGGYSLTDLQALADKIDLTFSATVAPDSPPEVTYVKTEVRGLAVINDLLAEANVGTAVGLHSGSALPNQVTFAIKKLSGFTGRSARGRIFWVGVPDNTLQPTNENLVTATWAANVVADIDFIRVQIETVGLWQAVIVSRFTLGVQRAFGVTFPWVDTTNVDLRVDTHRGRLP